MHDRRSSTRTRARARVSGFTLVELVVASVIAAMLAGAVALSTNQLAKSRDRSNVRQEGHARVHAAVQLVAREVANLVRAGDLTQTIVRIEQGPDQGAQWESDRLLIFNRSQIPTRWPGYALGMELELQDEGDVFEAQFALVPGMTADGLGVLWERRDPIPDDYYDAGGVAIPLVSGLLSFNVEAFDGASWVDEWDSDEYGIPYAIRISCYGLMDANSDGDDLVWAQTTVALDRMPLPEPAADGVLDLFGGDDEGGTGGTEGGADEGDDLFGGGGSDGGLFQ